MKPIIGIIICEITDNMQYVSNAYIHAISRFGGIPVVIPCPIKPNHFSKNIPKDYYEQYVHLCDGFLFCGGNDVTPLLFNEPLLDNSGKTDITTDLFHLSFMEYLLAKNKPILAICRGMQIMNLSLGGTIYQDLSLRDAPSYIHMQHSVFRCDPSHLVYFTENSLLFNIYGISEYTNSFHHQSIHILGSGLNVSAQTKDGVIEGIELSAHPFAIGVQWHPECMLSASSSQKLFFHFLAVSST